MTQIINLDEHRKHKDPPETSSGDADELSTASRREAIENMLMTLEWQHSLLTEMLENDVDYLEVTVAKGDPVKFQPSSLAVIMGNGSSVLTSGFSSLNSIEALSLKQKLTEMIFGE